MRSCTFVGCTQPVKARDLCATCYQRQRRNGTTAYQEYVPDQRPLWDRFWEKVDVEPGQCWLWTACTKNGYGVIWVDAEHRAEEAHRVAYELLVGPIPEGMTIDHLCRVTRCQNPDHFELVTAGENSRRNPMIFGKTKVRKR